MSIKIMSKVWEAKVGSHTAKLILLAIADHADDQGRAWPSISGIAAKSEVSRRTAITRIQELENQGFLKSTKQHGRTTKYSIQLVKLLHQCSSCTSAIDDQSGEVDAQSGEAASPEPSEPSRTTNKKKATMASPPFDSTEFVEAWNDWITHKKEIGNKLTPLASKRLANSLTKLGEIRAIAAINHSIEKGWKGVYEDKDMNGTTKTKQTNAESNGY